MGIAAFVTLLIAGSSCIFAALLLALLCSACGPNAHGVSKDEIRLLHSNSERPARGEHEKRREHRSKRRSRSRSRAVVAASSLVGSSDEEVFSLSAPERHSFVAPF